MIIEHGFLGTGECIDPDNYDTVSWQDDLESFRGFDYLARHLASRGYVVLSLDLREVDYYATVPERVFCAGITARQEIVRLAVVALADDDRYPVDLDRIALVGHSNGGLGVLAAASVGLGGEAGYRVQAMVSLDGNMVDACPGTPYHTGGVACLFISSFMSLSPAQLREVRSGHGRGAIMEVPAHHAYYNSVWVEALEAGWKAEWCDMGYGPPTPGQFPRVSRVTRCYATALLDAQIMGVDEYWDYFTWEAPLPPGLLSGDVGGIVPLWAMEPATSWPAR